MQGWTLSHSMFEFSNAMQIVEVFTPSADGRTLTVEATFYDPEAFTRPLHIVTPWQFVTGLDDPDAGSRTSSAGFRARSSMAPTGGPLSSRSWTMGSSITSVGPGRRTGKSISSRDGRSQTRSLVLGAWSLVLGPWSFGLGPWALGIGH